MNVSSRLWRRKTSRTWSATLGMSLSVTGPGQKGAKLTTHHYASLRAILLCPWTISAIPCFRSSKEAQKKFEKFERS